MVAATAAEWAAATAAEVRVEERAEAMEAVARAEAMEAVARAEARAAVARAAAMGSPQGDDPSSVCLRPTWTRLRRCRLHRHSSRRRARGGLLVSARWLCGIARLITALSVAVVGRGDQMVVGRSLPTALAKSSCSRSRSSTAAETAAGGSLRLQPWRLRRWASTPVPAPAFCYIWNLT